MMDLNDNSGVRSFVKYCCTSFLILLGVNFSSAQRQLDIEGHPNSLDTVATIKVNFTGLQDVVGLAVQAKPSTSSGIGGYFVGGSRGVHGYSPIGTGLLGESNSGFGVQAYSSTGTGVFSESINGYAIHGTSTHQDGVFGSSVDKNGVYGHSTQLAGVYGLSPTYVGVRGQSETGIGVQGLSNTGKGVRGESTRIGVMGTSITRPIAIFVDGRFGVLGYSDDTVGVYGVSIGYGGQGVLGLGLGKIATGVTGMAMDSIGIGVCGKGSSFDFLASGPGIDFYSSSSLRWKENIVEIPSPLDKISALRGVYFDWDEVHGGRHDIGMVAEEVGEVIPEIVFYEENGIDATGIDYSHITPLLVEGIKSLIERVEALENIASSLKAENDSLRQRLFESSKSQE